MKAISELNKLELATQGNALRRFSMIVARIRHATCPSKLVLMSEPAPMVTLPNALILLACFATSTISATCAVTIRNALQMKSATPQLELASWNAILLLLTIQAALALPTKLLVLTIYAKSVALKELAVKKATHVSKIPMFLKSPTPDVWRINATMLPTERLDAQEQPNSALQKTNAW